MVLSVFQKVINAFNHPTFNGVIFGVDVKVWWLIPEKILSDTLYSVSTFFLSLTDAPMSWILQQFYQWVQQLYLWSSSSFWAHCHKQSFNVFQSHGFFKGGIVSVKFGWNIPVIKFYMSAFLKFLSFGSWSLYIMMPSTYLSISKVVKIVKMIFLKVLLQSTLLILFLTCSSMCLVVLTCAYSLFLVLGSICCSCCCKIV